MAFVAGFLASGEGHNGEHPFDFDAERVARDESVQEAFDRYEASLG